MVPSLQRTGIRVRSPSATRAVRCRLPGGPQVSSVMGPEDQAHRAQKQTEPRESQESR
jgi:hypothetical protein